MSTETDSGTSTNGTSTGGECVGCDVGGLACTTEMYKKQAEVAEESTQALQGYQEKFDVGARRLHQGPRRCQGRACTPRRRSCATSRTASSASSTRTSAAA